MMGTSKVLTLEDSGTRLTLLFLHHKPQNVSIPDTDLRGDWKVVQKFQHRHLWSVTENEMKKVLAVLLD